MSISKEDDEQQPLVVRNQSKRYFIALPHEMMLRLIRSTITRNAVEYEDEAHGEAQEEEEGKCDVVRYT
jgi:hypothetical protein